MPVHCSKCGEELLGAVNRCWKCGQMFALPPEKDGRPPIRVPVVVRAGEPLEAIVVGAVGQASGPPTGGAGGATAVVPVAMPRVVHSRTQSTAELVDARRAGIMAMGGTVASLLLG